MRIIKTTDLLGNPEYKISDTEYRFSYDPGDKESRLTAKRKAYRRFLDLNEASDVYSELDDYDDTIDLLPPEGRVLLQEHSDAIKKRKDVYSKEGTSKYGNVKFADPVNKKYPIDTKEHVYAAWAYINMPKNAKKYSPADLAKIKSRIKAAAKRFGITISDTAKADTMTQVFVDIAEYCFTSAVDSSIAKSSKIQSLIFDKSVFKTVSAAKKWAKDHNFKADKVDETENSYRIRQRNPGSFKKIRTITITNGVKATIGVA